MARLYANENFPRQVVEALRAAGHDILTVQDAGHAGQATTDEEVLAFAVEQERAILTLDRRDFMRLHAQRPEHCGIIVCTQDSDIAGQARRIDEAIASLGALTNQLVRVNRPAHPHSP